MPDVTPEQGMKSRWVNVVGLDGDMASEPSPRHEKADKGAGASVPCPEEPEKERHMGIRGLDPSL